jgi:hypothetical protein
MASLQDDAVLRQLLDLVNRYMQWLQPSLQQQPAPPTSAKHAASATSSSRSEGLSGSSTPRAKVFRAPANHACLDTCVELCAVVIGAARAAGPQAVNTIRPLLTNRDTGAQQLHSIMQSPPACRLHVVG